MKLNYASGATMDWLAQMYKPAYQDGIFHRSDLQRHLDFQFFPVGAECPCIAFR